MPKKWSTKSPEILRQPKFDRLGEARFAFTDDYSVFHYSKMPDQIPDKGEALARIASYTLAAIGRAGIPHHFLAFEPPRTILVRFARVLDPAAGALTPGDCCRLVPLQVIFRNSIPRHASIRRRLAAGRVDLGALGLATLPPPGAVLPTPILEFTTKLEEIDRFVSRSEAQSLACLSDEQMLRLEDLARRVGTIVTGMADARGLVCADGKLEFAIDEQGGIILVDTAGTPDENRFTLDGYDVTKQVVRDYYLARGLERQVQDWVRDGIPRDRWPLPERLPPDLLGLLAELYRSFCERWTGERVWGAAPLGQVAAKIAQWER